METVFYDIDPTYTIRSDGIITNTKTGRIIRVYEDSHKGKITYRVNFKILNDGVLRSRCEMMHRLMARHFVPNPEEYYYVAHRNGDVSDYRIENLKWVSKRKLTTIQANRKKPRLTYEQKTNNLNNIIERLQRELNKDDIEETEKEKRKEKREREEREEIEKERREWERIRKIDEFLSAQDEMTFNNTSRFEEIMERIDKEEYDLEWMKDLPPDTERIWDPERYSPLSPLEDAEGVEEFVNNVLVNDEEREEPQEEVQTDPFVARMLGIIFH